MRVRRGQALEPAATSASPIFTGAVSACSASSCPGHRPIPGPEIVHGGAMIKPCTGVVVQCRDPDVDQREVISPQAVFAPHTTQPLLSLFHPPPPQAHRRACRRAQLATVEPIPESATRQRCQTGLRSGVRCGPSDRATDSSGSSAGNECRSWRPDASHHRGPINASSAWER